MTITITRYDFNGKSKQVQLDLCVPESYFNAQKLMQKTVHVERPDEFLLKVIGYAVFNEDTFPADISPMSERGHIAAYIYEKIMQKPEVLRYVESCRTGLVMAVQSAHVVQQATQILNELSQALNTINDTFCLTHGPDFPVDKNEAPQQFAYSNHPDFVMYGEAA